MDKVTLVIKPKSEYESDFAQVMDEYLLNFEDSGWDGNEDVSNLAHVILDEYLCVIDDSMIPVITANIIIRHQSETGYIIADFEKQLILRYAYILIYRSKGKVN